MKIKITCAILIIIFIFSIFFFPVMGVDFDNSYEIMATAINEHEIVTNDGHIWMIKNTLIINGIYRVTFSTKSIKNPYDDKIIKIILVQNPIENLNLEIIELDDMYNQNKD